MADFGGLGNQGMRFGVLVNRLLGLREAVGLLSSAPEIQPTYDIGNPRLEYLAPRGEYPWWVWDAGVAAVAAQYGYVGFCNPPKSRRCMVIEAVNGQGAAPPVLSASMLRNAAAHTMGKPVRGIDGRLPATDSTAYLIEGTAAAVDPLAQHLGVFEVVATMGWVTIGMVLPPSTTLFLFGDTLNSALPAYTFRGYTRPCTPDEMRI